MPKTKTVSPARSHGSISKSRRNKPRLSRSVCSPGPPTASGRLTTVIDKFTDQNMDSFAFSPLCNRLSVLTDKTDIEEPRRKSWWKNLNENSGNIMEALGNEVIDTNNAFEKIVEIDVVSQEKSNYDFELSDSSMDASVKSIVLPQRKLFNQNENESKQKFGQIVGVRENSAKLHNNSTIHHDKTIIAGTKNFFQRSQKPKQVFPAALLNMSHNKTVDKTKENISVSAVESKSTTRNIFGGRATNKNIFANFILTESDDEILDVQSKIFGFQKQTEMQPLIWQDQNSSDELDDEVEQVNTENCKENEMDVENTGAEASNESQEKVADDRQHRSCEDSGTKDDTNERNASNDEDADNDGEDDNDEDEDHDNEDDDYDNEDNDHISADDDKTSEKNQENADVDIVNKIQKELDNIDDQNVENHQNKQGENRSSEISANHKHNLDSNYDDGNVETEVNDKKKLEKSVRKDEQINNNNKQNNIADQSQTDDVNISQGTNNMSKNGKDKSNNENIGKNISHEQIVSNQSQINNVEDNQTRAKDNELIERENLNINNENRGKETVNQSIKTDNNVNANVSVRTTNDDNINCSKENVNQTQTDEINKELNAENENESADNEIKQHQNHSQRNEVGSNDDNNSSTENVSQQQDLDVDESQNKSDDEEVNQSNVLENEDSDNNENGNSSDENLNQDQDTEVDVTEDQSNDEVEASEEMDYEESENEDEHSEHQSIESEDADKNDSHRNTADSSQGAENKSKVDASQESDAEQNPEDDEEMEVDDNNEEINDAEEVIEGSPNVTHKTTNSNKNARPEAVLDGKIGQQESFKAKERNESFRKTKSMYKDVDIRPSLAPARESLGLADGTGSSVEGSGWDSHRTTRKTLRRTFGKDFTPRKSLRALVMAKSAHTKENFETLHSESVMLPQANSTEYPDFSNHEDDDARVESDHEESRNARLAALDIKLQNIRQKNLEKKSKLEEETKNFYKAQSARNTQSLFKIPTRPPPRKITTTNKQKKQPTANIFGIVPPEVIEDMKYKPPKRFKPSNASWITKRLYKFLENKLEQKYDYRARIRAEKLVETVYHFTKELRRQKVASTDSVKILKHEFARLNIVKTHFEFYEFFQEFMPREVRVKVVPDLVNKIALPRHGVFSDIL